MSFASTRWLAALVVIPLVLVVYRWARRRRRHYALRFPAVPTLQEVLTGTRSWATHVPGALALAALAALIFALARPRITEQIPVGDTAVMLVSDQSGSMAADDVSPTRLAAAIGAADRMMNELPASVALGAITFSSSANAAQAPSTDHTAARRIIDGQAANGGTDTGGALELALQLLRAAHPRHPPSAIVLLSDGSANLGPDPVAVAQEARRDGVPIYTVALGTPDGVLNEPFGPPISVPPDPQLMQRIAQVSGGRSFTAGTADELGSIYTTLGRHLGTRARRREITNILALGGVLLLTAAGLVSVRRWRLP